MLTQIARAHGLQGNFASALSLLETIPPANAEIEVRVLLERARVLNSSGDPAGARPLFEQAFKTASSAGFDHLAVDALHMIAIVAGPHEQDALNRRALNLAASSADPRARRWRASLLNNSGWTAFDAGRYQAALEHFQEALAVRRELQNVADIQVARWCVARTLRALERAEEALAIQLELAAEHAAAGTSDPHVDEEVVACRAARVRS